MIYVFDNDLYSRVTINNDGSVNRFCSTYCIDRVENETHIAEHYKSTKELLKANWKPMNSLETMQGGELLENSNGYYKRVFARLGGKGEIACYVLSDISMDKDSDSLKMFGTIWTAFELSDHTIVDEVIVTEMTMPEVCKAIGKTVKIIE